MPEGMTVEVIHFESPTEGKNAVVTRSVEFGAFCVAAGILGAAAREPVTIIDACCDRGMAIVARKDRPINTLTDLRGKCVGIWPCSTQLAKLIARGLRARAAADGGDDHARHHSIRVNFSEMQAALAGGEIAPPMSARNRARALAR